MGPPLFFYGTLRHIPLLEVVLGRPLAPDDIADARLTGFACRAVAQGPFPMLVRQAGADVCGILLRAVTRGDLARLDFYEGGFDYDLADVLLEGGEAAQVYLCAPDRWSAQGQWDFAGWQEDWAAMSCHAATEVMGHYGQLDPAAVAAIWPQFRARAWSRVQGAQAKAGQGLFRGRIEVARRSRAYTGYFGIDEVDLRHERFDGTLSPLLARSYFIGGDAAIVLPYDPARDRVLLVEQIRMGPLGRCDPDVWMLEPIAGRVDPGEQPGQTALREAREEAGLDLGRLEVVARGYASPGDSTSYFNIYVGLCDLPDGTAGIGGVATEAEDIRSRLVSFDDFLSMAERQALANTPLALLAYWLAYHRSRLRSPA